MIERVWHGWTTPENADVYETLLREEIFPGIAAKGIEGYQGIRLLRRPLPSGEVEFATIMTFDSLDAVRAFVGEEYETAYVPERARLVLARFDERSSHYEVREPPETDSHVGFESVSPVLAVRDLEADIAYYIERLGFAVSWRWGDPPVRAGVTRDGLELQLVSDGRFSPDGSSRVYFDLRGVEAYHATCVERGADIVMTLDDRPFGVRDFRVADGSGNILGFSEPLPTSRTELSPAGSQPPS